MMMKLEILNLSFSSVGVVIEGRRNQIQYDPLSVHYAQYLTNLSCSGIAIPFSNTKSCSELGLNASFLSNSDLHDITAVLCILLYPRLYDAEI
jgi:hypothetical protein